MKSFFKKSICIICILGILILIPICAKADSGWDTDYGSSSSDHGSSSYSSHDYGSSSNGDGGNLTDEEYMLVVVIIFIIAFFVFLMNNSSSGTSASSHNYVRKDVSDDKLKELLPDMSLEDLKKMCYEKFVAIQKAWMNFDYDALKELCTDELYNSYVADLEVLKLKGGQNIMEEFQIRSNVITDVKEENGIITVYNEMSVSFYDYVVDAKTYNVIRGNKDERVCNYYKMTFVRNKEQSKNTCPNCGAQFNNVVSGKCEYCRASIVQKPNEFVLSKKSRG